MSFDRKLTEIMMLAHWRQVCRETDECSTGVLKPLARWLLNKVGRSRNYGCLCVQHDFDFRFGPRYGIGFWRGNTDLAKGIAAAGHPVIAAAVWSGLTVGGWPTWIKYRLNGGKI